MLVGFGWGSGPVTAIKKMQAAWGLQIDGIVGPKTIAYIMTRLFAIL
ncbi:hypothetical protein FACS1894123_09380 [Bacteroidia bacterium]|nr:hypothetical protein FACS1894123_09380 [Bacteroidia bacterium]